VVSEGYLVASAGDPLTEDVIAASRRSQIGAVHVLRDEERIEIALEEKEMPDGERELLRISKAALQTKGWLSAASFQRTTKVLSDAALRGETDELEGLKPSIIVGKRIPSGTGFALRVDDETVEADEPEIDGVAKASEDAVTVEAPAEAG